MPEPTKPPNNSELQADMAKGLAEIMSRAKQASKPEEPPPQPLPAMGSRPPGS